MPDEVIATKYRHDINIGRAAAAGIGFVLFAVLAVLEFTSEQPDSSEHPSLAVAKSDTATYGDDIAIVGYPMYEGVSVSDGVICSPAHSMLEHKRAMMNKLGKMLEK